MLLGQHFNTLRVIFKDTLSTGRGPNILKIVYWHIVPLDSTLLFAFLLICVKFLIFMNYLPSTVPFAVVIIEAFVYGSVTKAHVWFTTDTLFVWLPLISSVEVFSPMKNTTTCAPHYFPLSAIFVLTGYQATMSTNSYITTQSILTDQRRVNLYNKTTFL